jgi:replication factor A1
LEFISNSSGVPVLELEKRIEAKRAKLAGLISKEGALQVIAAELNINFDKQLIKISQILPGMRKINVIGKIISLNPIKQYNKNGKSGRIASFILADDTSNIRTVLWDENHIDLFSNGEIKENNVVDINNASLRNGELHLASFSEIKLSNQMLNNIVLEKVLMKKNIVSLQVNENVVVRAYIVQMFEPKFFYVCPQCKKKVNDLNECFEHGKVVPEKRALLNFVIDDGTDCIRSVMFLDQIIKIISMGELETPDLFLIKKRELLGKELMISCMVRKNALYNTKELIVSDINNVDIDKLIAELEK